MTSPPPLLYDTYYHIYKRGANRENIFFQERNYEYFLKLYAKYIGPVAGTFAYIHQNPQKHHFVDDFREWKWSSYHAFLAKRPTKLQRERVLEWFGGRQSYMDLHARWVVEADSKWFAEDDED